MTNESARYRNWIENNPDNRTTFDAKNQVLANLNAPTLVTAIEVLGMRKFVPDFAPTLRIAFGTIYPESQLVEQLERARSGRELKKLVVPFEPTHLYWGDAMRKPLNVTLNKGAFYSWQNFGAELLDHPAGGIKPLVRLLPRDAETITKFSIDIGNRESQERLIFWAKILGLDLAAAQRLLSEPKS